MADAEHAAYKDDAKLFSDVTSNVSIFIIADRLNEIPHALGDILREPGTATNEFVDIMPRSRTVAFVTRICDLREGRFSTH